MFKRLTITTLGVVALIGGVSVSAGFDEIRTARRIDQSKPVGGDNCRNVKIKIKNLRPQQIRVTDFKYYDYDAEKWRAESLWANLNIAPQTTRERTRNLEHVRNDNTAIRLLYRRHLGGPSWSSKLVWDNSPTFQCTDGKTILLVIE